MIGQRECRKCQGSGFKTTQRTWDGRGRVLYDVFEVCECPAGKRHGRHGPLKDRTGELRDRTSKNGYTQRGISGDSAPSGGED